MDGEREPPWMGSRRVSRILPGRATVFSIYLDRARALPTEALAWLSLLAVALLSSGCGFHLQGSGSLPEGTRKVYIVTAD